MIKGPAFRRSALAAVAVSAAAIIAIADGPTNLTGSLKAGKLQLKSAGALAFGPDGVLFVGDSLGGSVAAIDTNDHTAPNGAASINVDGLDSDRRKWPALAKAYLRFAGDDVDLHQPDSLRIVQIFGERDRSCRWTEIPEHPEPTANH